MREHFRSGQPYVFLRKDGREVKRIALRLQAAGVDWRKVSLWSPQYPIKEAGDCFFSTLSFMIQILPIKFKNVDLKTGVFHHNGDQIFHCWIEIKTLDKNFIINVSNLLTEGNAVKIFPKAFYKRQNNFVRYIESYSSFEVQDKLFEYANLFPDKTTIEYDGSYNVRFIRFR